MSGLIGVDWTAGQLKRRLRERLGGLWKPTWRKTTNKERRPHPKKKRERTHCCVERVLRKRKGRGRPRRAPDTS